MLTGANGTIRAGTIQANGTATGTGYAPVANSGALKVLDPFRTRSIRRSGVCYTLNPVPLTVSGNSSQTLAAAVHTRSIIVSGNATLALQPGEYYFCQGLRVRGNATLSGDNLVLIFDEEGTFSAADNSAISLTGRTSGDWAGFVVVSRRENDDEMRISSSAVDQLLGTIYLPGSDLMVDASGKVAEASNWSVIVAKRVITDRNGGLTINSNYHGSGVPVPVGVGASAITRKSNARLKQ